jgi:hypothetical protein
MGIAGKEVSWFCSSGRTSYLQEIADLHSSRDCRRRQFTHASLRGGAFCQEIAPEGGGLSMKTGCPLPTGQKKARLEIELSHWAARIGVSNAGGHPHETRTVGKPCLLRLRAGLARWQDASMRLDSSLVNQAYSFDD